MGHTDLVTIVVPIYNVEKFLSRCVDSILNQTYEHLEIILVDDGSTDNSSVICDEYKKNNERIKVIHKPNGGLSDARNAGLNIATGKYVAFIDSDDYITVDAIEDMLFKLKENNAQIAVCNMIRFFDNEKNEPFYKPTENAIVLNENDRFQTLNQPSVCNKLFLSELFKNIRFPKGKFYEDTFVYHKLAYLSKSIVLTGKDSYWYFLRENSILGSQKLSDKYFDFIEAVYERTKFLYNKKVYDYSLEAFFSLYASVSKAYKSIPKNESNKTKFREAFREYNELYDLFIKDNHFTISIKQKIRFLLLRKFPLIHKRIY